MQARRAAPTPPPEYVTTPGAGEFPPATGVIVKTAVANVVSPALPSSTSVMSAQIVIGPAVPPGELTFTANGFVSGNETDASSLLTASVSVSELLAKYGFELTKLAVIV